MLQDSGSCGPPVRQQENEEPNGRRRLHTEIRRLLMPTINQLVRKGKDVSGEMLHGVYEKF
ncbi:MAG: hypothetical protein IJI68_04395, partial [Eggerthellaceae bacterium]|nr:hypothetical protein [Eggerthellaceae bacterium]